MSLSKKSPPLQTWDYKPPLYTRPATGFSFAGLREAIGEYIRIITCQEAIFFNNFVAGGLGDLYQEEERGIYLPSYILSDWLKGDTPSIFRGKVIPKEMRTSLRIWAQAFSEVETFLAGFPELASPFSAIQAKGFVRVDSRTGVIQPVPETLAAAGVPPWAGEQD